MNFAKYFKAYSKKYFSIIYKTNFTNATTLINQIKKVKRLNKKIFIFGNGAGASIASHFANDLTNTANIRVLSFDNSAQITCLSNDYSYKNWVKKIIEFYADSGDLNIFLSASGNSPNMINAANFCKKKKLNFFSITGFDINNKLNRISKNKLWIDSKSYNFVEMGQLFILLSIVDFFNKKSWSK